jgi:hypothetical protein
MRLYTSCLRDRRVLQIYYLTVRLLIIFSPQTPLTPVFKRRIVDLRDLSSRIRVLSTDCVKSFELLKEDAGIMVAFEDRRHNTIEIK